MNRKQFTLFAFLFVCIVAKGATCTAIANGNWDVAGTWSCGAVPTCGDVIDIPAGITVTVTSTPTATYYGNCVGAMTITIEGTLAFQSGKKMALPCGSTISVNTGGQITSGGGGGNSNIISICNTQVWSAGPGLPLTGPTLLPIVLLYFNSAYNSPVVDLRWATATEVNNKLFTIEKSVDGVTWQAFETQPGAGNSSQTIYYTAQDENPTNGISYYRLKQTDIDGNSNYCAITTVDVKAEASTMLFPNPSMGNTTIQYSSAHADQLNVIVADMMGHVVCTYTFSNVQKGVNDFELNTSTLAPGIYIVKASTSQSSSFLKLIKQ